MKKSTSKSIKSPAPSTKSVPASKQTAAAKSGSKSKGATRSATAGRSSGIGAAMATLAETATAAPFSPVVPARPVTTITALVDIGFGNTLFMRGEGPGLSWEKGIPLESIAADKWSISFAESSRPIIFKFLLNDVSWSAGEDYTVAPDTSISVTPVF